MSRNFELLQKAAEEREQEERTVITSTATVAPEWMDQSNSGEVGAIPRGPEGHPREELTKLVQRLFMLADSARVVVFSSVERGAGCTWLTSQVATMLATQSRNTVCLVDANLRHPTMHHVFSLTNHNGLADAVAAAAPLQGYLRRSPLPNLWLLTCGSPEKAESALNSTEALVAYIRQLRAQFDYVLIDSPPMNLYSDTVRLASCADGIALVLKANSSRREIAQRVIQEAKSHNVRILGAVLNQRTFPVPESIYRRL